MSAPEVFSSFQEEMRARAEAYADGRECTCAEPELGACWYHMSTHEQVRRVFDSASHAALESEMVIELRRTHQQMIIWMNGAVPGKLKQEVFDEAIAARDAYDSALKSSRGG